MNETEEQKRWPVVHARTGTRFRVGSDVPAPTDPVAAAERRLADAVRELLALGATPDALAERVARIGREAR